MSTCCEKCFSSCLSCGGKISNKTLNTAKEWIYIAFIYYKKVNNDGTCLTPALSILGLWTSVLTATIWLFWEVEHNDDTQLVYIRNNYALFGTVAGFLVGIKVQVTIF